MNHDELLAEIQKEINEKAFIPDRYYPVKHLQALRAVVELHQQLDDNSCRDCVTWYPCLTIQAIEKELE